MTYHGQWDPPVDKVLHERYFRDRVGGVFIECGAFDGVEESCCLFFERERGWTGVSCEPVPALFSRLVVNRPTSTNLNVALAARSGRASFTHVIHPERGEWFGNGSLRLPEAARTDLADQSCEFVEIEVDTITYGDLVRQVGIVEVDLFVLDVEGHELEVIEGMKGCDPRHRPKVLCVEFVTSGLERLADALATLCYELDDTSFNNAFFVRI